MSNVFTQPTITGYAPATPPDDGTTGSNNVVHLAGGSSGTNIKTDYTDPVKTYADAISTNALSAFAKIFLNDVTAVSTTYTVLASDRGKILKCSNTITVNLLAAATAGAGFALAVRNNGSGTITLDGNAAETINGSATLALSAGQSCFLTSDGANWIGSGPLVDAAASNTFTNTQTFNSSVTFAKEIALANSAEVATSNSFQLSGINTLYRIVVGGAWIFKAQGTGAINDRFKIYNDGGMVGCDGSGNEATGGAKGNGAGNFTTVYENGTRCFSSNSMSSPALQTPVSSTTLTFAHGLGTIPSLYTAVLVAGSAPEHGYTAGDEVAFLSSNANVETIPVSANATNVYVEIVGLTIASRTTHLPVVPTLNDATKWQVKVRAWK